MGGGGSKPYCQVYYRFIPMPGEAKAAVQVKTFNGNDGTRADAFNSQWTSWYDWYNQNGDYYPAGDNLKMIRCARGQSQCWVRTEPRQAFSAVDKSRREQKRLDCNTIFYVKDNRLQEFGNDNNDGSFLIVDSGQDKKRRLRSGETISAQEDPHVEGPLN